MRSHRTPSCRSACALLARLLLIAGGELCLAADAPRDSAAGKKAEIFATWPFSADEAARRQEETARALGVSKVWDVDLGGGVKITMVLIPAGKYRMGDPPGRDAVIAKPFYLGKYDVTQTQYMAVVGKNPSLHKGNTNPADTIQWEEAAEFCKQASEKTKKTFYLPDEAQWEWACRAGTTTLCYWGDDMKDIGDYCWWHDNCAMHTHPVGQKKPNAFGLYDMMGNVWEWCRDGGPGAGTHPVRGATFGSRLPMFKTTTRSMAGAGANDRYGFRVAMDVE